MKILMISIFAPHFFNWTAQLKDSGHEVYWLDVLDSNTRVQKIDFVNQIIGWRYKIDYRGRYFVKKRMPLLYKLVNKFNERGLPEFFEKTLKEIQPDVVQSFVMYSGCVPIYNVMERNPGIKWIYSAWGNDLFFYQNVPQYLKDMKFILPKLNYMFADCTRDYLIAKKHGFKGEYLGTFPGGGGYELNQYTTYLKPFNHRKLLLIKGYQHKFGRCISVLEAIIALKEQLSGYNIVVFAANEIVMDFSKSKQLDTWENLTILGLLSHDEILKLMGETKIYVGNSISDGMPNTLLEAIIMGAFPIQSNPGGATAELIEDGKNGLLIENPENIEEIRELIKEAISDEVRLKNAVAYNFQYLKPNFERNFIKEKVLMQYKLVEKQIKRGLV